MREVWAEIGRGGMGIGAGGPREAKEEREGKAKGLSDLFSLIGCENFRMTPYVLLSVGCFVGWSVKFHYAHARTPSPISG